MERLKFETGGRPRTNDDLVLLQASVFDALESQFKGLGAFILFGCAVTPNGGNFDISSGIVFLDSKIMRFPGATNVSLPRYIAQATVVDTENRVHDTGGSKPTQTHIASELLASAPGSGEYITMTSSGGRSYYDAQAGQFVRMLGAQTVLGEKTMALKLSQNMHANGFKITNLADPTGDLHAVPRLYARNNFVRTDAGAQSVAGTKTFADLHLSGDMNAGSARITNLADPTADQNAATKRWTEGVDIAWTNITLTGTWAVTNGQTPQFRVNRIGQLEIRGMINGGGSQFFCAAGTVPAAFRPPAGTSSPNYIPLGTNLGPESLLIWSDGAMSIPSLNSSRLNVVLPPLS